MSVKHIFYHLSNTKHTSAKQNSQEGTKHNYEYNVTRSYQMKKTLD